MNGLNHNALTCSAVPIPPWERSLQTVEAQPYFSVSQASLVLEGIVFDRNNNLLFVDVATGRVFKLTPERQLSIVLKENSFGASGLAVHKDGRITTETKTGDFQPATTQIHILHSVFLLLLPAIMYVTGYCTGMKGTSMRH